MLVLMRIAPSGARAIGGTGWPTRRHTLAHESSIHNFAWQLPTMCLKRYLFFLFLIATSRSSSQRDDIVGITAVMAVSSYYKRIAM